MIRKPLHLAVAAALFATLAVAGCKKKTDETATTPPPASTEPAPAPAPAPAPMETPAPTAASAVSVTSVDLGTTAGADMKIAAPSTSFAKTDKEIVAAVSTNSTAATPASGKLGAKWTFQDGQVVHEESKDYSFTGPGVTQFKINNTKDWPVGKYKLDVSLDGNVVQSKDFEIK